MALFEGFDPIGDIGSAIGLNSPFHKKDYGSVPAVDTGAVPQTTAPGGVPSAGAQFSNPYGAGWQGYTGGKINGPAGPTAAQLSFMGTNGVASANQFNDPFAQAQLNSVTNLQGISTGAPGTSLAERQALLSGAQNQANTYALANTQRGFAQPAVTRAALQQGAAIGAQTAQQAQLARAAEQLQAAGLLGQVAGTGREQGLQAAQTNAQLTQQAGLAGYQGGIQTAIAQGQIDQDTAKSVYMAAQNAGLSQLQADTAFNDLRSKYAQMGLQSQIANQQAAIDLQRLIQAGAIGQAGINAQEQQAQNSLIGGMFGAAGTIAGAAIG